MALMNWQENSDTSAIRGVPYSYNYERHLENSVLRNAASSGYFNSLTVEDLLGQCRQNEKDSQLESSHSSISDFEAYFKGKFDTLSSIKLLNLNSSKLRAITAIGACVNLTICDLSGNYLKNINALESCKGLRKLDLHQNMIIELPDSDFWSELINLQALYMHDNGLSTFEEIKKLCNAPNLLILTLYDTPVCLKMYYRHFIANSIWSLKALDHVVISDEEIVEDANFSGRFQAMQPQFSFKSPSLARKEESDADDEIKVLEMDIAAINKIQAKFCPVLIIQKFARGLLARLRYQYEQEKRYWAAVIIQRSYRTYRGYAVPQKPPVSDHWAYAGMLPKPVDYDTYIRYKRAGRNFTQKLRAPTYCSEPSYSMQGGQSIERANSPAMKLYINLTELEASTSKLVDDSTLPEVPLPHKRREKKLQSRYSSSQLTSAKGSKIFLNSISKFNKLPVIEVQKKRKNKDTKKPTEKYNRNVKQEDDVIDDSEDGLIAFRLAGLPAPRMESDVMENLTKCIVEGARDIRDTLRRLEMRREREPEPVVQKSYPMTVDQKLFIRTHGTMSLSCFRAVDQAYKDRDRAKSLQAKMQQNLKQKRRRDVMVQLREHRKFELIEKLQSIRSERKNDLTQAIELQKSDIIAKKEYIATKKEEREQRLTARKRALAFAAEFNNQANAIYTALASHATTAAKGKIIEAKREKARCIRDEMTRQHEIIKRYNEHRKLLLQSEISLSKSKLETELEQRSIKNRKEARSRVKKLQQGNSHKDVTVPCISSAPSKLPPLAIVADTKITTWEDMPKNDYEVREHDRFDMWLS